MAMMAIADSPSKQPGISKDGSIHIVIAEDNAITRRMIELAVTHLGWTFDSAADGLEALSAAERTAASLSLVLADFGMPKMTGIELAKALKALPSLAKVPVLLMGSPHEELEAVAAGCDGFLTKPISMKALLEALNL
jgi:two-component system chemotaxis response regulator CheY